VKLQLAPTASVVPQVLLAIANELALLPPSTAVEIVSAAVPLLVSVAICVAALVPTVVVKESATGASVTCGVPVTVPLNATLCVAGLALSVTVSIALYVPAIVTGKPTVTLQVAPTASVAPQVLLCVKAVGFAPPSVMDVIVNVVVPVFVSVAVWLAAAEAVVAAKVKVEGDSVAATGAVVTVPESVAV
jgi:hypothetical protein